MPDIINDTTVQFGSNVIAITNNGGSPVNFVCENVNITRPTAELNRLGETGLPTGWAHIRGFITGTATVQIATGSVVWPEIGGQFTEVKYLVKGANAGRILAGTATSLLSYDTQACEEGSICGIWGTLKAGVWNVPNSAKTFGQFDLVGSTASTLMFYESGGIAAFSTLKNGVYQFVATRRFASGWTLIVGGR